MDNPLRVRLRRLNLFLDLYADLPLDWQERVEREVWAVCLALLGLRNESLDPPVPVRRNAIDPASLYAMKNAPRKAVEKPPEYVESRGGARREDTVTLCDLALSYYSVGNWNLNTLLPRS